MQVSVIGGGASGNAIAAALRARGAQVHMLSRTTGFDVLRDDAKVALAGSDAVIEATGVFTLSRRKATDFFTTSTARISEAANSVGAHHILLSIANCERPDVAGYGYLAAKAEQEHRARATSERVSVVRSTQWYEFAAQSLQRLRFGPIGLVPTMTLRPVALTAVADVLAEVALGGKPTDVDVAGPVVMTLVEMTAQVAPKWPKPVPLHYPGATGRAFRSGALLPENPRVVGPSFAEWLSAR